MLNAFASLKCMLASRISLGPVRAGGEQEPSDFGEFPDERERKLKIQNGRHETQNTRDSKWDPLALNSNYVFRH